ncbi:hypothetical protein [Streptomyces bacillaris]|uniref:hypothetical protein n=1 Tax=Streptomyces bacillaris TaxID=68179 RepID=UPI0034609DCB
MLAPGLSPEPAGYPVWRGAIPLSALAGRPGELELLRGAWVTLGFPGGHGIFYLIPSGDRCRGEGDRLLAYAIYGRPPASSGAGADPGPYVRELAREHFPERVLREGPTVGAALERYADERTAAGAHLLELGRRMGRAQVDEAPDWAAMGQGEVDAWFRGVLAGTRHHPYARPATGG